MTEEARAARNAYRREYRRKNPDKIKAQQERYWTKKARKEAAESHRTPDAPGHRSMEEMRSNVSAALPGASMATLEKLERVLFEAQRESVIKSISQ